MKFIIDKEISLKNQDLLHTRAYASTLKEVLLTAPDNSAFTIGLFGEWGSGKSSIVKTVEEEISDLKNPKIKFIIYDAWKYANDSFRRMFLFKVQQELDHKKNSTFESFYRTKNSDVKISRKIDIKFIVATVALLFLGLFLIYYIDDKKNDLKLTITLIISFLGVLVNVLGRAFSDYKVTVQEPLVFAPEQFEECFDEMVSLSLEQNSFSKRVKKWVTGESYISGLNKIVIVIDNIDRCPKELAYELITNIKNFLGNKQKLIFLIPVDDEALKRHIEKQNSENSNKEAEEFLRKFFNVAIRIKPFKRFDLYDFTNAININENLQLNPTTLDIISKEYATNPRRIIQFFNNLMSELEIFKLIYKEQFTKDYESLICKMLLLREEWPVFYNKISMNPSLLNNPDENLIAYLRATPDLETFLSITDSITRNEKYENIEAVLSTSLRLSKIPIELIEAIQKKNIEFVSNAIANKSLDYKNLINYLIERLNTSIKRKTFLTDANNIFEFLASINEFQKLDLDQNRRIFTEIRYSLDNVIPFVSDFESICKYSNSILDFHFDYLDNWIRDFYTGIISGQEQLNYQSRRIFFHTYIKNQFDNKKIKECSEVFLSDFEKNNMRLEEYNLNNDQLFNIINDKIFTYIINEIEEANLNDKYFQDLVYLANNKSFDENDIAIIFEKINKLFPNFNNKTKEQVIDIIDNVTLIIKYQKAISSNLSEGELNSFYHTILAYRILAGNNRSILTEITSEDDINKIILFLISIYTISIGKINILSELSSVFEIDENAKAFINNELLRLKQEHKFHLTPLRSIILNDHSFSNENLELTKYILTTRDKEGEYNLSDEDVMPKLEKMITAYNNEGMGKLKSMLDELSDDPRAGRLLTFIISKLEKNIFLTLSKKLQCLAFDMISMDDNIYEYENNIDFIKTMAEKGSISNCSAIARLIVNKLTKKEKNGEAVEILEHVGRLSRGDKNKINSSIEDLEDEDLKSRAKAALDKI